MQDTLWHDFFGSPGNVLASEMIKHEFGVAQSQFAVALYHYVVLFTPPAFKTKGGGADSGVGA